MAFGKKTDRAGLQAVLELKNVDYSKDPEIQQLYTRLVNGRSQFGQILAKNASASLQIAEVVDALKEYNSKMESVSQEIAQASEDATKSASESSRVIEFRFDEKISDLEFQQRFAPDTENIIAEFRPIAQEIADASEITYTGVVLMFLDSEGQRVQSIPIGANNSNMIVDFSD